jgi:cation transport ATPase
MDKPQQQNKQFIQPTKRKKANMKLVSGIFLLLIDILLIAVFFAITVIGTIKQPIFIALFLLLFGLYNLYYIFKSKFWAKIYSPANTTLLTSINLVFTVLFSLLLIKTIAGSDFSKKFGTNDEDYYILIVTILIPVANLIYNAILKSVKKANID